MDKSIIILVINHAGILHEPQMKRKLTNTIQNGVDHSLGLLSFSVCDVITRFGQPKQAGQAF